MSKNPRLLLLEILFGGGVSFISEATFAVPPMLKKIVKLWEDRYKKPFDLDAGDSS